MTLATAKSSPTDITAFIGAIRRKGGRLWSENGQLHYEAPKGAITRDEIETLRSSRAQILALLARDCNAPSVKPPARTLRAPLTFSQLENWHSYQLSRRPSMRQIASATRFRGRLHVETLRGSFAELVRHHEALRTRIVVSDGIPIQEVFAAEAFELAALDLRELEESARESQIPLLIDKLILQPVDISIGPLFAAELVILREDEFVLIMVMDHIIADGYSRTILLRDLSTAYAQAVTGQHFSLPETLLQLSEYALRQRESAPAWLETQSPYWDQRLAGCGRLRFPGEIDRQVDTPVGWGFVPFQIDRDLKVALGEWCRLRRTTLVMGIFTAYAALVLRWCNACDAVISFQSDSRTIPEIENTIGLFTSVLYMRIELLEGDSFDSLLRRNAVEYCQAYEHADFSYLAAQTPRPAFTRNSIFNWSPKEAAKIDLTALNGSASAVVCTPIPLSEPFLATLDLDYEPIIQLYEGTDEISGNMYFPLGRFSPDTMEVFTRNFLSFIRSLVSHPDVNISDVMLLV